MPALTLKEVADKIGGEAIGPVELVITGASGYESAGESDLAFVDTPRLLKAAEQSRAAAMIVSRDVESSTKPLIRTDNPRLAFALALELFYPRRRPEPGVHPTAVVGAGAELGSGIYVGPYAVIGERARIGVTVELHAGSYVGDEAEVGDGTIIYSGVRIYRSVRIGERCIIHSGCVIGADGFGFARGADGRHIKVPQVGTVIIGDEVEIGANSTIDRATTDATVIGRGTKIDNLVQIGHNCRIGRNCVICGMVGLSGSVEVGDGAVLAGQAGIADHLAIGKGAIVAAQAGVTGDIPDCTMVSGYPARPHREQLRLEAAVRRMPEALAELRDLRKRIAELEERVKKAEGA
jgi:UDP-3-O-[3-hydroxymyristoyl] glucosamine N-acyltransferase